MKRIAYALKLVGFICWLACSLHAQNSRYVKPVPECGRYYYDESNSNNTLMIENLCSSTVSITWTSPGDVWGAATLGPGSHQSAGVSADHVGRSGGVELFTCPGDSGPVDPNGKAVGSHYSGSYGCQR
jgi:hypothetical protein